MKIYNEIPIVNKYLASFQIKVFELDKNINVNDATELLERDYNSIDDFLGALNTSSTLSEGQKRGLIASIILVHKNDDKFIFDLLNAPNAKIYTYSIFSALGSIFVAEWLDNSLQKKD